MDESLIRHRKNYFALRTSNLRYIRIHRSCSAARLPNCARTDPRTAAMKALEPRSILEVLVVDDSPVSRKIFDQLLPTDLYSVSYACNGRQALQAFKEKAPSIVITDWVMPDFSGLELCRRIREDRPESYTYVIVMTSNKEEDAVLRAMEAGADDFLVKPFNS